MSEKRVAVLSTEFKAVNPGQVVQAAKHVAKSMDEIAAAAARQEKAAAAARASSAGAAQAAATGAARAAAETKKALELQADVARGIGRTVSQASIDAKTNLDSVTAAAARAAAKIREEAARPVDKLKLDLAFDEENTKRSLDQFKADRKRIEREIRLLKEPGSSAPRGQRQRYTAQRAELDAELARTNQGVRSLETSLAKLKAEGKDILREAAAAAGAAARAQIQAEEAKVAAARTTLTEIKVGDAEKQIAAKATADAGVLAAKRQERETVASAKRTIVEEARKANAMARANERAARDAAAAWRNSQNRIRSFSQAMPRAGILPGGVMASLATRGTIPVVFGMMRAAASAAASVAGVIGSVFSGALGVVGSLGKAVWNVSTGLLGIVGNAIKAAASLVWNIGVGAVKAVLALGSAAASAAGKVASIAKTVVVRTVLVGTGLAAAGLGLGMKATKDAGEAATEANNNSIDTGASLYNSQAMSAAAKRAGLDQKDVATAMKEAQGAMKDIASNPELLAYFERLGVGTRTLDGRLLDTSVILQNILSKSRELNGAESMDLLDKLFGSRENWEKIYPLVRGIADSNNSLLGAGLNRQFQLGSLMTESDIVRGRAMKAVLYDFKDAVLGVKLAISRAIGDDVIRGLMSFTNGLATSRFTIAAYVKLLYDVSGAMFRIARYGDAARGSLDFGRYLNSFWYRGLIEATAAARQFGIEVYQAFSGIKQQQGQVGPVFIKARQWIVDLVATGFYAQRALASTLPFWHDLWATLAGNDQGVTRYTWLLTVRNWISDLYNTLAGRDGKVATFPGLIAARDTMLGVGRAAREVWYALSGQDEKVSEFPVILRIKQAITGAIAWVKQFAIEAWDSVTNAGAVAEPKFPWMYAAANAVRQFVADVKTTWADLGNVWNGGAADTTVGGWLQTTINYLSQGEAYVRAFVANAKMLWLDLQQAFSGNVADNTTYAFPWIKDLAKDLETVKKAATQAWEAFKTTFGFIDRMVQRLTFGKLTLESVILFTTLMGLFGVFRTVGLVVWAARAAFMGLGSVLARVGAAIGGGAAAGAGAAAAGAGVAGAMTAVGTATAVAGGKAATASGKWDKLKNAISGVKAPMLGLAAIAASIAGGLAGDWMMNNATPDSAGGRAMSIGGGALQYGAMGAGAGMMFGPKGALVGGALGGIYGAFAGQSEYLRRTAEAKAKAENAAKLRSEGREAEAQAVEKSGSRGWDEEGDEHGAEYKKLMAEADAAMKDVQRLQSEAAGAARKTADSFASEDWDGAGSSAAASVSKAFSGFDFGGTLKGLGDGAKSLFSGASSKLSDEKLSGMAGVGYLPPSIRQQALTANGYYDPSKYPAYADPLSAAPTRPVPAPEQRLDGANNAIAEKFEIAIPGLDLVMQARATPAERDNIRQVLERRGGSPQWSWEGVQP